MGCCHSNGSRKLGLQHLFHDSKTFPSSAVGITARELSAYDFSSENFVRDYLEHVTSQSLLGKSEGKLELRKTHSVPRDYATIQDALDAAKDGDAIRIAPGRYKEALVIRSRVLLVGLGKVDETVLEAPDESIFFAASALPTLILEASEARVCNVTIVGCGASVPVVENMCGDLTLEGCDIRSGACGLRVQDSAGAILRFCDVRSCHEHGVNVSKQGWVSIEKSYIFDCKCGVLVGHLGSQGSLRGTDIASCSQVGVMAHSLGAVLLESNHIHDNTVAGVFVSSGGRAVLKQNRVCKNGQVGVCVVENSEASINENDLRGNGVWSLYVAKCSAGRVTALNNPIDAPNKTKTHIVRVTLGEETGGGGSPTMVTCGSDTPDEIFFSTLQDTIESPGLKAAATPTSPSTSMLDTLIPEDSILKGGASFDT